MDFNKMMNTWLDSEESWNEYKKDEQSDKSPKGEFRSFLRRLAPEDEINLHGSTTVESEKLLFDFIKQSKRIGLRKILIIHGKGNHSQNGSVLTSFVRSYIESSSFCGESGNPDKCDGGKGATWVILK